MRQHHDEAYVLGTRELGESDLIVTLLAERSGRLRGVAAAARKSRRRFGGALEPLSRVRVQWSEREGRELSRIEALDLERSYAPMQAEPARQAACAVLAEIILAVVREGQGERKIFRLMGAVLDALEAGLDPLAAVRYFEYWVLKLHGILPAVDLCAACGSPFTADAPRWAVRGVGLLDPDCARTSGEAAKRLHDGDLAFLAAAAVKAPGHVGAHARESRPGGALEALLRGGLEAFAERSFRTYRHLHAALPPRPTREGTS